MAHAYLLSFAKYGSRDRFEYTLGTLASPDELHALAHEYGTQSFGMSTTSRWSYPLATIKLARWLANHNIDLVQTHLYDPCFVGMSAAQIARVPCAVYTAHHVGEWEVTRLGSRPAAILDRFVRVRLADHVIAPSDYMARVLLASGSMNEDRLSVIPHGIDAEYFAAARGYRRRWRAELGLEDATVLGAVGRIYPVKNYPALIRAFAELASAHPSLTLVVLGQGSSNELAALARSLGIAKRVRFVGWRPDVRSVLSTFDLFVHVSLTESFGLALVEALAAGIPVVSTPVGIASNLIEDRVSGLLLQGTDKASIVRGLTEMLHRRDQWGTMAIAGQARARLYSAQSMVAKHEALYERLLGGRR